MNLRRITFGLASAWAVASLGLTSLGNGANTHSTNIAALRWTSTGAMKEKWGQLSLKDLRDAAEKGEPEAQHYLAWRYSQGEGIATNQVEAVKWYRKAAEQGFPLAQNNLGALYESGSGLATNLNEAVRWYQLAARQGLPVALRNLGWLARSGQVPSLKRESYQTYFEQAAERGDMAAATALGRSHLEPLAGQFGNPDQALHWLSYAANSGWVDAYADVAWLYMDGHFVPRDYAEALQWFSKGAEAGDARCQLGVAMHELSAHADAPDLAKARTWMLKAADNELPAAFFQLGRLSELRGIRHPSEVKPDYEAAAKWYQRAADEGHTASAGRLAELAIQGRLPKDASVVARLQRASDLGSLDARLELALRYWRGEGKPRNAEEEPEKLLRSLVASGKPKAMIQLADFHRTGTHFPKDPVQAIFLLHRAAAPALWDADANMRLAELKSAVDEKRSPAEFNKGLEASYTVYRQALVSPEAAARVGRGYLDGTYPTNQVIACAWLSLAVEKGGKTAEAERNQLNQKLDADAKAEAHEQARRLSTFSRLTWPGE